MSLCGMMGFQHFFSSWSFVCAKQVQKRLCGRALDGKDTNSSLQVLQPHHCESSGPRWSFLLSLEIPLRKSSQRGRFVKMTQGNDLRAVKFSQLHLIEDSGLDSSLTFASFLQNTREKPDSVGQGACGAWHNGLGLQDASNHYYIKYNIHYIIWLFAHRTLGMTEVLVKFKFLLLKWRSNEECASLQWSIVSPGSPSCDSSRPKMGSGVKLLRVSQIMGRQNITPDLLTSCDIGL